MNLLAGLSEVSIGCHSASRIGKWRKQTLANLLVNIEFIVEMLVNTRAADADLNGNFADRRGAKTLLGK